MSADAPPTEVADGPAPAGRVVLVLSDWLTLTWRNVIRLVRVPESLFFSSVQPVMFVLLFRYVFGGAIHIPVTTYVNFLIAGVYVQTVMFGAIATSVGLAEDLHSGLIERFRALPMARSAVLAGRTAADTLRNVGTILIITAIGYAVGFRIQTNPGLAVAGLVLVLFFAYALSWTFAIVGLSTPNAETAQLASFPVLFPFTFASSAFVTVHSMPGWLQAFAVHQPVSQVIDASRYLLLGAAPGHWTASNVWQALAWTFGLLVVFAPIAVWRFRRST